MALSKSEILAYIREAAAARGISPDVAVRVAQSEGLNGLTKASEGWQSTNTINGRRETSYGPFQLYTGGGLGNLFKSKTGLSPSDPETVKQQIDFALDYAAQNGWSSWYGAKAAGISNWQGLKGAQPLGVSPAVPAMGAPLTLAEFAQPYTGLLGYAQPLEAAPAAQAASAEAQGLPGLLMPPSSAPATVDNMAAGRASRPMTEFRVAESMAVPAGPFGADAIIKAAMTGDTAGMQAAMSAVRENVRGSLGLFGAGLDQAKQQLATYFNALPQQAQGAMRAVQGNVAANPAMLDAVPAEARPQITAALDRVPPQQSVRMPMPTLRPETAPALAARTLPAQAPQLSTVGQGSGEMVAKPAGFDAAFAGAPMLVNRPAGFNEAFAPAPAAPQVAAPQVVAATGSWDPFGNTTQGKDQSRYPGFAAVDAPKAVATQAIAPAVPYSDAVTLAMDTPAAQPTGMSLDAFNARWGPAAPAATAPPPTSVADLAGRLEAAGVAAQPSPTYQATPPPSKTLAESASAATGPPMALTPQATTAAASKGQLATLLNNPLGGAALGYAAGGPLGALLGITAAAIRSSGNSGGLGSLLGGSPMVTVAGQQQPYGSPVDRSTASGIYSQVYSNPSNASNIYRSTGVSIDQNGQMVAGNLPNSQRMPGT